MTSASYVWSRNKPIFHRNLWSWIMIDDCFRAVPHLMLKVKWLNRSSRLVPITWKKQSILNSKEQSCLINSLSWFRGSLHWHSNNNSMPEGSGGRYVRVFNLRTQAVLIDEWKSQMLINWAWLVRPAISNRTEIHISNNTRSKHCGHNYGNLRITSKSYLLA